MTSEVRKASPELLLELLPTGSVQPIEILCVASSIKTALQSSRWGRVDMFADCDAVNVGGDLAAKARIFRASTL